MHLYGQAPPFRSGGIEVSHDACSVRSQRGELRQLRGRGGPARGSRGLSHQAGHCLATCRNDAGAGREQKAMAERMGTSRSQRRKRALLSGRSGLMLNPAGPPCKLRTVTIQESGGIRNAVEDAKRIVYEMLPEANNVKRQSVSAEHLRVGLQSGGADAFSGLSADPTLGAAV